VGEPLGEDVAGDGMFCEEIESRVGHFDSSILPPLRILRNTYPANRFYYTRE
jgi:hypothetical protein